MENCPLTTSKKLSKFIEACMDPLPDAVLIDTQYNSMVRQQRRDAWRAADAKTRCYKALREVAWYVDEDARYCVPTDVNIPPQKECLRLYRQAVADQLLTPVERKADIAWKRRQLLADLPVTEEQVAEAIAADERFIAMHPTALCGRRSGREAV